MGAANSCTQTCGVFMSFALFAEQVLNGLQSGIMLFVMAAGLTLIFGVMGLINLAHGSLYMVGAFAAGAAAAATTSATRGRATVITTTTVPALSPAGGTTGTQEELLIVVNKFI